MPENIQHREIMIDVREVNKEKRTIKIMASTKNAIRGLAIPPEAWDLTRYRKNPVIMWAHDYYTPPIGRAQWVKTDDNGLLKQVEFANTPFADEIFQLYADGFLNAWSVGFMLKRYVTKADNEDRWKELKKKNNLKIADDDWIATSVELYETSAVPLPADQDALTLALERGDIHGHLLQLELRDALARTIQNETEKQTDIEDDDDPDVRDFRSVVSFQDWPTADENMAWSATTARKQIAAWASSDGSGDKDKIDWKKYAKGFIFYKSEAPKNVGSYIFPIVYVTDGQPKAVWRGIAAAMQRLLAGQGVPASFRKAAYNHLVKYYKKFDKTAPDFKSLEGLIAEVEELIAQTANMQKDVSRGLNEINLRISELESIYYENSRKKDESENRKKIVGSSALKELMLDVVRGELSGMKNNNKTRS